jgi:hypothetical protein
MPYRVADPDERWCVLREAIGGLGRIKRRRTNYKKDRLLVCNCVSLNEQPFVNVYFMLRRKMFVFAR